ncbi:DUF2798 domain-containing protein [Bordetella muralis]|jgi:hypothetical protein|uniref:DUF2798 domain-containing protein n=1 Tax=Bordetella muralis TaxID=1649130 RepID=UPI0039EE35A9
MLKVPNRYSHFVFSAIQSGLTCCIASAISSAPFYSEGSFVSHWGHAYVVSWTVMLPLALVASPVIRKLAHWMTN